MTPVEMPPTPLPDGIAKALSRDIVDQVPVNGAMVILLDEAGKLAVGASIVEGAAGAPLEYINRALYDAVQRVTGVRGDAPAPRPITGWVCTHCRQTFESDGTDEEADRARAREHGLACIENPLVRQLTFARREIDRLAGVAQGLASSHAALRGELDQAHVQVSELTKQLGDAQLELDRRPEVAGG